MLKNHEKIMKKSNFDEIVLFQKFEVRVSIVMSTKFQSGLSIRKHFFEMFVISWFLRAPSPLRARPSLCAGSKFRGRDRSCSKRSKLQDWQCKARTSTLIGDVLLIIATKTSGNRRKPSESVGIHRNPSEFVGIASESVGIPLENAGNAETRLQWLN